MLATFPPGLLLLSSPKQPINPPARILSCGKEARDVRLNAHLGFRLVIHHCALAEGVKKPLKGLLNEPLDAIVGMNTK